MATRFIGVKELRQNMAKISNRALKNKERLIVLRKNKPIFELKPFSESDTIAESFRRDITEARHDGRDGRMYSQRDIEKKLGL